MPTLIHLDSEHAPMRAQEVADFLSISAGKVYELRDLPPRWKYGTGRKGKRWRREDVKAWLDAHVVESERAREEAPKKFVKFDAAKYRKAI